MGAKSFYLAPIETSTIYHLPSIIYHISYMHRILELQSFRPGRYRSNSRRIFKKNLLGFNALSTFALSALRYIRLPPRPLLRHTSDSYIHDLLLCVTLWEP